MKMLILSGIFISNNFVFITGDISKNIAGSGGGGGGGSRGEDSDASTL
jgi:hypothetical protein